MFKIKPMHICPPDLEVKRCEGLCHEELRKVRGSLMAIEYEMLTFTQRVPLGPCYGMAITCN